MNTNTFKAKMRRVKELYEEIENIINDIPDGLKEEINNFHNEDYSLLHCNRWGLQAAEELERDAKRLMKEAKENGAIW